MVCTASILLVLSFALPALADDGFKGNAAVDYSNALSHLPEDVAQKALGGINELENAVTREGATDTHILDAVRQYCAVHNTVEAPHPFARAVELVRRGADRKFHKIRRQKMVLLPPELPQYRRLAGACMIEAAVFRIEGRPDRAAEILIDVRQMGLHVAGGASNLIEAMVGIAVARQGNDGLARLLMRGDTLDRLKPPQARALHERLGKLAPATINLPTILRREADWGKAYYVETIVRDWPKLSHAQRLEIINKRYPDFGALGDRLGMDRISAANKQLKAELDRVPEIVTHWRSQLEKMPDPPETALALPYERARDVLVEHERTALATARRLAKNHPDNPFLAISEEWTGMFTHQRLAYLFGRANHELTSTRLLTGAAVARSVTGQWPESLDAIEHLFPDGVPSDPFCGKPFVYERTEKGPVIRSSGPHYDEFEKVRKSELNMTIDRIKDAASATRPEDE